MSSVPVLLTMREVGERLRMGRTTVHRLIRRGELDAYKVGGRTMIDESSLIRVLRPVIPTRSSGSDLERFQG